MATKRTAPQRVSAGGGRKSAEAARLSVGFLLARDFTLTAFSTFVDTLRLASDEGDRSRQIRCRWTVMSASGRPVRASCGLEVAPQAPLRDPGEFDYIVVVGGLLGRGAQIERAEEDYLRAAAASGASLVGVCTGSFVLARTGLLERRRCCVSWYHRRDFGEEFPEIEAVSDRLFLIDGDRITCSGGAGAADLAAALVERHLGGSAARKSLSVLLFEAPRPAEATQPMPPSALAAGDARVRRAVLMMEENPGDPQPIAAIARRLGLSERQLERLFRGDLGKSPGAVALAMRVDYGRWLVETGARTVGEIAVMAGFADGAHFARAFRKRFGAPPSAFRGKPERASRGPGAEAPGDGRLFG